MKTKNKAREARGAKQSNNDRQGYLGREGQREGFFGFSLVKVDRWACPARSDSHIWFCYFIEMRKTDWRINERSDGE